MKVVWLVSNYPHHNNTVSGIFYERMAEALASKGIDISILALTPYSNKILGRISSKWDSYAKYPKYENRNRVQIFRPRYLAIPYQKKYSILCKSMYASIHNHEALHEADIIDAHYAYPFGCVANLLTKKYNLPFVVSLRGDDVNIDPYYNENTKKLFIKSIKNAASLIAVSKAIADRTKELSGYNANIVNVGLKLPAVLNVRKTKKDNTLPFTFIFVGALTRDKGLHLIVRLLQENVELTHKKYSWVIIGDGIFKKELSKFPNVSLTGQLPNNKVLEYMSDSDLMVFPSLNEGMPNVLKEAGSLALPIVASDVGGIPDLLNNGERGIMFKRDDYSGFKEAIFKAIENYKEALKRGKLLQEYIYENFNIDKNADQLISVYKNVIENYYHVRNIPADK